MNANDFSKVDSPIASHLDCRSVCEAQNRAREIAKFAAERSIKLKEQCMDHSTVINVIRP